MERTYQSVDDGEEPLFTDILLLLSIFAGAALVWTPELLEKLNSTPTAAKAAFSAYSTLALSILDNTVQPITPSTTALEAISVLTHVLTNADGFPTKVHVLRIRGLLMAREMQIHRLDTVKCREERESKGCNLIEVELQRRIWWQIVSSDW